jgi:uncharacterized protein YoxC
MDTMFVTAAMSTPSLVLRYAAAFFFVVVAIFLAYALFKAAKALERVDKVLADVDENGIPLMQKAGDTLDGVNANLGNADEITKDVAGITDKLDKMASSLEGAVTTPARKAAAFSAGVQSAVSNFMKRDKSDKSGETASGAAAGWSYEDVSAETPGEAGVATPAGEAAADAAEAVGDAAATAAAGATDTATAAGEAATDAAAAAGEAVADAADAQPDGA